MATADPYAAYGTPVGNAPAPAPAPVANPVVASDVYLQRYNAIRGSLAAKFNNAPAKQQQALTQFDSNPRVQLLRQKAGLAPVSTAQNEVRAVAKQSLSVGDTLKSALLHVPGSAANFVGNLGHAVLHPIDTISNLSQVAGGEIQKIPGARNILQSIGADPAAMQQNDKGASAVNQTYAGRYGGVQNILQTIATDPVGALADASTILGGAGGVAGLTGKAAELSGVGDTAATASRLAESLGTASRRVNPLTPIVGTAKAAVKGIRNTVGLEPVESVLRKYVKTPIEDIQASMTDRALQGLPSSIYEVLPLRDRESLDDAIAKMPANARERLAGAVRQRATGMAQETSNRAQQIITPQSNVIRASIAQDLARSRGDAAPSPADHVMALEASRNPTVMEDVGNTEAANIMAPYDAQPVGDSFQDLLPHVPGPDGTRVAVDPEVASIIRTAAGRKSLRPPGNPLTVGEISGPGGIIPTLRKIAAAGGRDAATAENAVAHLEGVIGDNVPGAGDAVEQMRGAYAARKRMAEGVAEGRETRTEPDVTEPTRKTRNAYNTPEGAAGRVLGQASKLESDLSGKPDRNLRVLNEIAQSPSKQKGISGNLGGNAGEQIADVAEAQSEAARRLGRLTTERSGDPAIEPANVMKNLMAVTLHTNPGLRTFALARLLKGAVRVPERQAHALTDMLFSTNPTQISRALTFLNRSGDAGRQFIRDLGRAAATGGIQANAATAPPPDAAAADHTAPPRGVSADTNVEAPVEAQGAPADVMGYPVVTNPDKSTWDKRADGSTKGTGFLGLLQRSDGSVSSEISVGVGINGKETEIPLMVPGLTKPELDYLMTHDPASAQFQKNMPRSILDKATAHATARINAGLSPFKQDDESTNATDDYSSIGEEPHGRMVIEHLFPGAEITEDIRDPNSKLGRQTPNSYHDTTDKAVDLRPIKGMTFDEFIQKIKNAGYDIIESRDEVNHPSQHATGPHWHVVIG